MLVLLRFLVFHPFDILKRETGPKRFFSFMPVGRKVKKRNAFDLRSTVLLE